MVFFYSKYGQLANRIWQAAYFVSNAMEHRYTLFHLGFGEYANYFSESFKSLEKNENIYLVDFTKNDINNKIKIKLVELLKKSRIDFPFLKTLKYLNYEEWYNLSDQSFIKTAKRNIIIVDGWFFYDRVSFSKHSEILRKIFKPNQMYIDNVEKRFKNIFSVYDIVVGVHIRRGDYATYRNGEYFYPNSIYKFFIQQIILFPTFKNKKIGFVVCSNEKINSLDFQGMDVLLSTNSNFIEDLYTLSICNYIIGPPSTFSSWASFFGKVPLMHISHPMIPLVEDNFKKNFFSGIQV